LEPICPQEKRASPNGDRGHDDFRHVAFDGELLLLARRPTGNARSLVRCRSRFSRSRSRLVRYGSRFSRSRSRLVRCRPRFSRSGPRLVRCRPRFSRSGSRLVRCRPRLGGSESSFVRCESRSVRHGSRLGSGEPRFVRYGWRFGGSLSRPIGNESPFGGSGSNIVAKNRAVDADGDELGVARDASKADVARGDREGVRGMGDQEPDGTDERARTSHGSPRVRACARGRGSCARALSPPLVIRGRLARPAPEGPREARGSREAEQVPDVGHRVAGLAQVREGELPARPVDEGAV
jgi:hypothetical protein